MAKKTAAAKTASKPVSGKKEDPKKTSFERWLAAGKPIVNIGHVQTVRMVTLSDLCSADVSTTHPELRSCLTYTKQRIIEELPPFPFAEFPILDGALLLWSADTLLADINNNIVRWLTGVSFPAVVVETTRALLEARLQFVSEAGGDCVFTFVDLAH